MKLLHLFVALFTATLFLACSTDKESLQVETNLTTNSEDVVELQASGAKAYSWRQLIGTDVILVDPNSATASFIAPSVTQQESLVFELEAVTAQIQNKDITLKKQVQVTVYPKANVADSTSGMDSSSGEVEPEQEQTNETNTTTETNTTQPTVSLQSLKLTLEKNSLNIETNITLQVVATYDDNSSKDVTDDVEWIYTDNLAISIQNHTLKTNHKDTNIFLQAKYKNQTSNKVALEIYKEINGHRLPPEPDPTINNATILGVDTNDNGVRDDVERWVYETYKEPVERGLFMQSSYAFQNIIEDPSKAHETVKYSDAVLACEFYWEYDSKDFILDGNKFLLERNELKRLQFNTINRHIAYEKYNSSFNGKVLSAPDSSKEKCIFNENGHLEVQP